MHERIRHFLRPFPLLAGRFEEALGPKNGAATKALRPSEPNAPTLRCPATKLGGMDDSPPIAPDVRAELMVANLS
jgi:hypothetical protein